MIYYSAKAGGFYDTAVVGGALPEDAIEISKQQHAELVEGQSQGKAIVAGDDGKPLLAPRAQDRAVNERGWRDVELSAMVWLRDRHRDQLDIGASTTLNAEQFSELLVYMQALRDWPQSETFPDATERPQAPPWIAEQAQ